jgi:hypothetical protein
MDVNAGSSRNANLKQEDDTESIIATQSEFQDSTGALLY